MTYLLYGTNDYLVNQGYDNKFDKILSAILIDEAQFLTEKQVKELSDITVILDIPVICFGLRTDFRANLFPGSEALFRYANSLEELTTVCVCGKKALHNARLVNGKYVSDGSQVAIDEKDNVTYISLCPEHYREFVYGIKINEERKKIMPVANAYKVDDIIKACKYYIKKTLFTKKNGIVCSRFM